MDDPLSDNVHIIHGFKNHLVEKKLLWENITYVNETIILWKVLARLI